ncbi:MAG: hypothetical protein WCE38_15290 [Burkholderiales bacterium]
MRDRGVDQNVSEAAEHSIAVLVFPGVVKPGRGVGGQFGEGVLYRGGKAVVHYNTACASIGLQTGAQKYGYAFICDQKVAMAPDTANQVATTKKASSVL